MSDAQINSLKPDSGTPAGGNPCDISGQYLSNTKQVNWGDATIPRSDLDVSKDGQKVTVKKVPKGTPKTVVDVSVTTADHGTSNVLNYTYSGA
ncbi:IPT/TIG domain-containing protein [Kitasatospora sp. NPDC057512]|uniref:IPT/TIG domain-containing protein n=1 Tax=Kitasatospora sp. NPDC057512 TaxID=3346154 RepID=UPI0036ABF8C3